MDDYIRKIDAVEALDGKIIVTGHENADAVLQYMKDISNKIKSLSPADVVPVRLGEWLDGYKMQTCSLCKCRGKKSWTFCPHCGARMIYGKREE